MDLFDFLLKSKVFVFFIGLRPQLALKLDAIKFFLHPPPPVGS